MESFLSEDFVGMICHLCNQPLPRKMVTVTVVKMLFLPIVVLSIEPTDRIEAKEPVDKTVHRVKRAVLLPPDQDIAPIYSDPVDPNIDSVYSDLVDQSIDLVYPDLIDKDAAQVDSDPTEIKTTLANSIVDVNVDPINLLETTTLTENSRSTERVSEETRTDSNKLSTTDAEDLERTTNSLDKDNRLSSSSTTAVSTSTLTSTPPDTTSTSKTSKSITSTTTQLTTLSTSTIRTSVKTTATQIPSTTPQTTSTSTPQSYSITSTSSTQISKTSTSSPTLNATLQFSSTPQNVQTTRQSALTPYISEVASVLLSSTSSSSDTAYSKDSTQVNSDVTSVSPLDTSYLENSTQLLAGNPSVYASTVTSLPITSEGSADVTSDSLLSTPSLQNYTSHGSALVDEKALISSASMSLPLSSSTSLSMTSSIMTSSPSTTTRTPTPSGSRVLCPCYFCSTATKPVNLKTLVKELVDRLKVDQSALSTTRRMRESQNDERPSAKAVGYVGVVFMVVTLLVVVLFDISRICCQSKTEKRRFRRWNR